MNTGAVAKKPGQRKRPRATRTTSKVQNKNKSASVSNAELVKIQKLEA